MIATADGYAVRSTNQRGGPCLQPHTYAVDPSAYLEDGDERLLEEEVSAPADSKRSRHHKVRPTPPRRGDVDWLVTCCPKGPTEMHSSFAYLSAYPVDQRVVAA